MRAAWRRRLAGLAAVAVATALTAPTPALAAAEPEVEVIDWEAQLEAPIRTRDVRIMARALQLSDGQREVVEGLVAEFDATRERLRWFLLRQQRGARQEREATGSDEPIRTVNARIEELVAEYERRSERLVSDVQLLLEPAQQERWERFELRRARTGRMDEFGQVIGGLGVDVETLAEDLELTDEQLASLDDVFIRYGREMETMLGELERRGEELEKEFDGGNEIAALTQRLDEIEELFDDARDDAIRVRDVNERYAKLVAERLGDEQGARLLDRFNERAFPRLYAESYVGAGFRTVLDREDLSAEQRTAIEELRAAYEGDVRAARGRAATARRKLDATITFRDVMGRMMGGDVDAEIRAPVDAVDERYYGELRSLLNEEQRRSVPLQRTGGEDDWRSIDFGP